MFTLVVITRTRCLSTRSSHGGHEGVIHVPSVAWEGSVGRVSRVISSQIVVSAQAQPSHAVAFIVVISRADAACLQHAKAPKQALHILFCSYDILFLNLNV